MDSLAQVILGIIVFIILFASAGFLLKKISTVGRNTLRQSKYLASLDRLYIANDKWIEIVDTGSKILILGVTQGSITVLETINQEDLNVVHTEEDKNYFASLLEKYIKK